ncbi:hypothetical protein Ddc_03050 [Ditylenchus destructor]|nr:hypothetical protein Ddc_03050 [Ditylenchus destructor]
MPICGEHCFAHRPNNNNTTRREMIIVAHENNEQSCKSSNPKTTISNGCVIVARGINCLPSVVHKYQATPQRGFPDLFHAAIPVPCWR